MLIHTHTHTHTHIYYGGIRILKWFNYSSGFICVWFSYIFNRQSFFIIISFCIYIIDKLFWHIFLYIKVREIDLIKLANAFIKFVFCTIGVIDFVIQFQLIFFSSDIFFILYKCDYKKKKLRKNYFTIFRIPYKYKTMPLIFNEVVC
jgi:hypothetical protein